MRQLFPRVQVFLQPVLQAFRGIRFLRLLNPRHVDNQIHAVVLWISACYCSRVRRSVWKDKNAFRLTKMSVQLDATCCQKYEFREQTGDRCLVTHLYRKVCQSLWSKSALYQNLPKASKKHRCSAFCVRQSKHVQYGQNLQTQHQQAVMQDEVYKHLPDIFYR